MESIYFSDEHSALRVRFREFLAEHVLPFASSWESAGMIPREIWSALGERGFLGLHRPREYGGTARDIFFSIAMLEELGAAGYGGFRGAVSVHAYMASEYVAMFGSPSLKERYLRPSVHGEKIAALAITERDAGSDLGRLKTTAVDERGGFVLRGDKMFVTNGLAADYLVVAAKTHPSEERTRVGATGVSMILVDRASPGLTLRALGKMGWHCSDTAEVVFDDVWVPRENLCGLKNAGFQYIMQCFQLERLVAAAVALGGIDRCLAITLDQLEKRQTFGAPLSSRQALRHRLADLATDAAAARQLVYDAAWQWQRGGLPVAACSMAKLKATEVAKLVADECLQFHGGYGYLADAEIGRLFRDFRLATIVGGTSEVQRDIIAQLVIDERRRSQR